MADSASQPPDDANEPSRTPGRVVSLRAHARRRRGPLPWSDGSIVLGSLLIVMLLAPVWVDPTALRELTGDAATPPPSIPVATPRTPVGQPVLPIPPIGEAPPTVIVRDTFSRPDQPGWGTAELGGPYAEDDRDPALAVIAGAGSMLLPSAGTQVSSYLTGIAARDLEVAFSFTVDALPIDGAIYVYAVARRTSTGIGYRPKVFVTPDGALFAHVGVLRNGVEQSLGRPAFVSGTLVTPGAVIHVRTSAQGGDPTILRVRAWADGDEEPVYWNFGAADWTGSLQGIGSVGLAAYLGVRHPGGSVRVGFDNLIVTTTDLQRTGN